MAINAWKKSRTCTSLHSAGTLQNKVIQFYHTEYKVIRCEKLPKRGSIVSRILVVTLNKQFLIQDWLKTQNKFITFFNQGSARVWYLCTSCDRKNEGVNSVQVLSMWYCVYVYYILRHPSSYQPNSFDFYKVLKW